MALPVSPHPDAAPRTRANRAGHDVDTVTASSDPYLEFLAEKPGEAVVREPVFVIVPVPSEPLSDAARGWPQDDQFLSRERNVPADVGLFRTFFRRVLSALRRGVVGIPLALYRGVVGALLALDRGVVGALLALHRGVMGTLLALRRSLVGALLALNRGVMGTFLALRRSLAPSGAEPWRDGNTPGRCAAAWSGALLIRVRRDMVGALLALHRARRGDSPGAAPWRDGSTPGRAPRRGGGPSGAVPRRDGNAPRAVPRHGGGTPGAVPRHSGGASGAVPRREGNTPGPVPRHGGGTPGRWATA